MPFKQTVMMQYRDTDTDAMIGLRGVMRYFQDIHVWYMRSINKGNDVLRETYGAGWIYTRTHSLLKEKINYRKPVVLTAWMEPYRLPVLVNVNLTAEQDSRLMALGKVECCVYSLTRHRPILLDDIDFPENFTENIPNEIPGFIGLEKNADGMEERYQRTVRMTDLDRIGHMTNLRYIEMFQDAHDSRFWTEMNPKEMEISYLSQCMEGETLSVRSRTEDGSVHLAAVHEDGRIASAAVFLRGCL